MRTRITASASYMGDESQETGASAKRLLDEYQRLKARHMKAVQLRVARVTLGASVMRVFVEDTRVDLVPALGDVPVADLRAIKGDEAFRPWFETQLGAVAEVIDRRNEGNQRIHPGAKWGHASKILTIFLREMVSQSRFFRDAEAERIERLLYVPLDRVTITRLGKLGMELPFKRIREIDTAEKFYRVQDALGAVAREVGIPRVWFDDNWGDREG